MSRFSLRPRVGFAALAVLALTGAACGRQAHVQAQPIRPVDSETLALPAQGQPASPPATPAGPTPVPATFDVATLAERVQPFVVNITTTQEVPGVEAQWADPFDFFLGQRGGGGPRMVPREHGARRTALGTGFIIDPAGYVVTNEHVVHDADEVRVRLSDDRELKAEVVGRDPKLDLALLKLEGARNLPSATLGSSDRLRVGESVLAVGNPFGLGHTVTLGIVSAKARSIGAGPYDDFIQTDASINPGNSGGPLFDWKGEVVGINTAIKAGANGIGFAIPVDSLKDVLPQLRDKGHVDRGRLGLAFQPVTQDLANALGLDAPRGALITDVEAAGPAARAGLRAGDVVTAVNGAPITHATELPRNVARNPPGASIRLSFLRDRQAHEATATLDALQDDAGAASRPGHGATPSSTARAGKLGLQVSDAPGGGVRVDDLAEGSSARDLAPGDVIVEIDGVPVRAIADLQPAMAKLKPGTTALLRVRRGRSVQYAAIPIPAR